VSTGPTPNTSTRNVPTVGLRSVPAGGKPGLHSHAPVAALGTHCSTPTQLSPTAQSALERHVAPLDEQVPGQSPGLHTGNGLRLHGTGHGTPGGGNGGGHIQCCAVRSTSTCVGSTMSVIRIEPVLRKPTARGGISVISACITSGWLLRSVATPWTSTSKNTSNVASAGKSAPGVIGVTLPSVCGRPFWLPARMFRLPRLGFAPLRSIDNISVCTMRWPVLGSVCGFCHCSNVSPATEAATGPIPVASTWNIPVVGLKSVPAGGN